MKYIMKALKRLFIVIILPITVITSKPSAASESEAAAKLYINHGRINLFGLVHQQYYNKLGNEKESSFISKRARLGVKDIGMSMTVNNKFSENLEVKFDAGIFNGSGINTDDLNTNKNFISRLEIGLADMFTIAPNLIVGKTNEVDNLKEELSSYGGSISCWYRGK